LVVTCSAKCFRAVSTVVRVVFGISLRTSRSRYSFLKRSAQTPAFRARFLSAYRTWLRVILGARLTLPGDQSRRPCGSFLHSRESQLTWARPRRRPGSRVFPGVCLTTNLETIEGLVRFSEIWIMIPKAYAAGIPTSYYEQSYVPRNLIRRALHASLHLTKLHLTLLKPGCSEISSIIRCSKNGPHVKRHKTRCWTVLQMTKASTRTGPGKSRFASIRTKKASRAPGQGPCSAYQNLSCRGDVGGREQQL